MEPDNSIIHHGCWRTRFTSVRMEAGRVLLWVCAADTVFVRWREQLTSNCWRANATQWERKEGRGEKEEGAVINMAIKGIWSGRWGSKRERREGEELVPLSSLKAICATSNPLELNQQLQRKRLFTLQEKKTKFDRVKPLCMGMFYRHLVES